MRQTDNKAFTVTEVVVSMGILCIVGIIWVTLLNSGLIIGTRTGAMNNSGGQARRVLDRLNNLVRISNPTTLGSTDITSSTNTIINVAANGTVTSGTLVSGTTSGDALLVDRYIGGPFVFKQYPYTTGIISSSGSTANLVYSGTGTVAFTSGTVYVSTPTPDVGDWLYVESVTRPERQIASVQSTVITTATTSYSTGSGTSTFTTPVRTNVVTVSGAFGEDNMDTGFYTIKGFLHVRECYAFVSGANGYDLRHYPMVTAAMVSGNNYSTATSGVPNSGTYTVLASGFIKPGSNFFQTVTVNGVTGVTIRAITHDTTRTAYIEKNNKKTFTTFPLNAQFWNANQ